MSSIPECLTAHHANMAVLAFCLVTNQVNTVVANIFSQKNNKRSSAVRRGHGLAAAVSRGGAGRRGHEGGGPQEVRGGAHQDAVITLVIIAIFCCLHTKLYNKSTYRLKITINILESCIIDHSECFIPMVRWSFCCVLLERNVKLGQVPIKILLICIAL